MKRLFLWFVLLNKRLYKKITFIGILLLIPVVVVVFNMSAQQPSGIVTVMLGIEDPNDPVTAAIVEKLEDEAIVISFMKSTPEQALVQVRAGKVDAAWIFPADMQAKILAYTQDVKDSAGFIRIVEREETVALLLAREKLSGAVYEQIAKQMYLNEVRERVPKLEDAADEELLSYLEATGISGELFAFYDIYGNAKEESGNYLTTPLRGMLAILVVVGSVVTAMYYQKDQERGIFSLLTERQRIFGELGYQLISALNIMIFVLIALISSGLSVKLWQELLLVVLYSLCCSLFGMTVRTLLGGDRLLAVMIPVLSLAMLVICPVFFDMEIFKTVQFLFPPTYYISGAYNYNYILYMLWYCVGLALVCCILQVAKLFVQRNFGFRKSADLRG